MKGLSAKYSALISYLPKHRRKKGGNLRHIDDVRGIALIELSKKRKGDSIGITISGGTDKGCAPFISNIRKGGIADQCDYFCVGEDIISINGTYIRELKHSEIIQLVQEAGKTLIIEVQFKAPIRDDDQYRKCTIQLQTEEDRLGFSVKGGESKDSSIKRPVIVTDIEENTWVSRSGVLCAFDQILKVNGKSISGLHISQVKDVLSFVQREYTMEIQYGLPNIEPYVCPDGTLTVEMIKPNDVADLGISLDVSLDNEDRGSIIIVAEIIPGSIADRIGCICVGDLILNVNGISFEGLCLEDAVQVLLEPTRVVEIKLCPSSRMNEEQQTTASSTSSHRKFSVTKCFLPDSDSTSLKVLSNGETPTSKAIFWTDQPGISRIEPRSRKDQPSANGIDSTKQSILSKDMFVGSPLMQPKGSQGPRGCRFSPYLSKRKGVASSDTGTTSATLPKTQDSQPSATQDVISVGKSTLNSFKALTLSPLLKYLPANGAGSISSFGSFLNQSSFLEKYFSKTETLKLRLEDPSNDFGMQLEDILLVGVPNKILVSALSPGKVADRTGVIMVGDRILSINGMRTEFITSIDVDRLMLETKGYTELETEFSVADTVVPTSGSFRIKLQTSSNGTGITLGAPSPNDIHRFPRILDIKKGSTAYRSGILAPGDQLLYIDDTDVSALPISDVNRMMNSGSEVIKLVMKKDEEVQGTTFAVELERRGQQLGITISGSENPFDPILITGISEEGLAHKSRAVLVGDRLLAINGESLRGKSLTKAYELLKDSESTLKLVIKRKTDKTMVKDEIVGETNVNKPGEPQVWTWMGQNPVHVCVKDSSTISMIHEKESVQKGSDAESSESYCGVTDSSQSSESCRESPVTFEKGTMRQESNTLAEEVLDCIRRSSRGSKSSMKGKANTLPRHNSASKHRQIVSNMNGLHRGTDSNGTRYDSYSQNSGSNSFKRSKSYQSGNSSPRRLPRRNSSCRQMSSFPTVSEEKTNSYHSAKQRHVRAQQGSFDWSRALSDSTHFAEQVNYQGYSPKQMLDDVTDNGSSRKAESLPNYYKKDCGRYDAESESQSFDKSPFHSPRATRARLRRPDVLSFSSFPKLGDNRDGERSSSPPSPDCSSSSSRFPFFPVTLEQVVLQRTSQSTQTSRQNGFYGSSESISSALVRRKTSWREATERYELELRPRVPSVSIDCVTLKRESSSEDFGFSVSEKVNGSGIYVRSVQPRSSAADSGKLKRYDRILQVNGIHTRDIKCDELVPFLQRAGRKLEMVIERIIPARI